MNKLQGFKSPLFPTHIAVTVVFMVASIFSIMMIWYITQPLVATALMQSQNVSETGGWSTTGSDQLYTILRIFIDLWGPALVIMLLMAWGIASTQRGDYRSEYY